MHKSDKLLSRTVEVIGQNLDTQTGQSEILVVFLTPSRQIL